MQQKDTQETGKAAVPKWVDMSVEWMSEWTRMMQRSRNAMRLMSGHKPEVAITPHDVIWTRNKMRLLRYHRPDDVIHQPVPLLFVPSVINRYYILDLQPGKSLVEFLAKQGFDVFIIDWGKPQSEDRYITFDDVIERLLGGCMRHIRKITGEPQVHLVGHCLGGMLTLAYASLHQQEVATLVNMTTPVDLTHGGILRTWTKLMNVDLMVDALGNAPWPLLQMSFHMLKPMTNLQKSAFLYERLWDDPTVDSFMAMETWSNDNVSISGEFFRTYIKELYQKNALFEGKLLIDGQRVDLRSIKVPVLNIAAAGDHIAPEPAVVALDQIIPQTQNMVVKGGHVGSIVSRRASKKLWPQLASFFLENQPVNQLVQE